MKSDNIKALLQKYFEGETSLTEEEILRTYFKDADIPDDLQSYKDHFSFFEELREVQPLDMPDDETLFSKIIQTEKAPISITNSTPSLSWLKYAAGVALLVLGFAAGWLVGDVEKSTTEMVDITNHDNDKNQVILTGLNNQSSASERILAINESLNIKDVSQEIAQALIRTMNYDDNVNVRLAAIEALSHYTDREEVKKSLIQSLEIQENPMIQIALIDLLVNMEEKRAINEIQRLMIDENTQEVVKQRAEVGVALLM